MNKSIESVLRAVVAIYCVSRYLPTIGEIARVAGVSHGVADRALAKLECEGFVKASLYEGKILYRFAPTKLGKNYVSANFGDE